MNFGEFFKAATGSESHGAALALSLLNQPLVFVVCTNPKPLCFSPRYDCESAVVAPYSSGPKGADLLKVERWVLRIPKPEFEVLSREITNLGRQRLEPVTETSFRRGNHPVALLAGRDFPAPTGRGEPVVCRCERLPRSGGPTRRHGARADDEPTRKNPFEAVLRSPARSLGCSSRLYFSFALATFSSRFTLRPYGIFWGMNSRYSDSKQ